MSDAFDPYFKWLGIPKADQPPHGYRLLGIDLFESDVDVISNAADGRMAQIKSFQSGKFAALSQKLLNEIAAAKVCLLNPQKKAEYDRRLRAHLQQKSAAESAQVEEAEVAAADDVAGLSFLDESTAPKRSMTRPAKKSKQPAWLIPAVVSTVAIALVAAVLTYFFGGDNKGKPANPQTASLANGDREAPPSVKSSGKATAGTSQPNPRSTGIGATAAREETHAAVSLPDPALPTPNVQAGQEPKTEFVAEPEKKPSPPAPLPEGEGSKRPLAVLPEGEGSMRRPAPLPEGEGSKRPPAPTHGEVGEKTAGPEKPSPPAHLPEGEGNKRLPAALPERIKKPPIPDKEEYQAMRSKILKIFQKEFAEAKTAESKLALAVKLDKQGDASKDDPVERYSLWRIAADGASVASEFSLAMNIVDKIQAQFDVDGDAMKAELLSAAVARSTITPEAARNLGETALKLAGAATAREDFDAAARFAKLAVSAAHRVKDPAFSRDVLTRDREIERLKNRYAVVAKAVETLNGDAENADANLAVGQWQCLVKGNWGKGLPYLAKGSREDLAALAKRELAKPAGAKEQVALADAWWALAEKDSALGKTALQARARHWYSRAAPGLSGLEKIRVEKNLATQAAAEPSAGDRPIHAGRGNYQRGNVALLANGTTFIGKVNQNTWQVMFDGDTSTHSDGRTGFADGTPPFQWMIVLGRVYSLREIRFKFWDLDNRFHRYRLSVSSDGKSFAPLVDRSQGEWRGWQTIAFPARPAKFIKLDALYASAGGNVFAVTEFEAYCVPPEPVGK